MNRILIIDDDPSGTQLLATLLRLEGYEALSLQDWQNPLRDVEQHQPNLVMVDVRLRGKDGFQLLEQIRTHPNRDVAQTPVLMMSVDDHQARSRQRGADGFIAKPFDLPALGRAIQKIEEDHVLDK